MLCCVVLCCVVLCCVVLCCVVLCCVVLCCVVLCCVVLCCVVLCCVVLCCVVLCCVVLCCVVLCCVVLCVCVFECPPTPTNKHVLLYECTFSHRVFYACGFKTNNMNNNLNDLALCLCKIDIDGQSPKVITFDLMQFEDPG